ncbi:MAG TPA: hypothetical protein VE715_01670 [Blastocatellia bacterium]|nr:hypothetical protein [Blastocatellia bacterium]
MEIYAKGQWQFVEKIRDMFLPRMPVVSRDTNDATEDGAGFRHAPVEGS